MLYPHQTQFQFCCVFSFLESTEAKLSEKISQLETREVGINEDRLLRFLSKDYLDFEDLVQKLIDTEKEATFEALQRLALKGLGCGIDQL